MANHTQDQDTETTTSSSRNRDVPAPLIGVEELKKWSFYRALIAELFGALVFVYVSVSTTVNYFDLTNPLNRGTPNLAIGIVGIAWTFGVAMFLAVHATTRISGGHINPAVTFGMLLARKISLIRAVMYVVAQCLGALTGAAMTKMIVGAYEYNEYGGGANLVTRGYSNGVGLAAEIIGSFVLIYVVFCSIHPRKHAVDSHHLPVLAAVPIGFAVFAVHLATFSITRTGINPARSLATTIVWRHTVAWRVQWIFWVGPMIGAFIATFFHQIVMRGASAKNLQSFRNQSLL